MKEGEMGGRFRKVYMGGFCRRLDNRHLGSPSFFNEIAATSNPTPYNQEMETLSRQRRCVTVADRLGLEFQVSLSVGIRICCHSHKP
jgi:hypothetical protein